MPDRSTTPVPDDPYPAEKTQPLSTFVQEKFTETGWTLASVADRAGLSVATVWAIKKGTRGKRPRPGTLVRLARGLDLPADALLGLLRGRAESDGTR